jgi:hypothetical protein
MNKSKMAILMLMMLLLTHCLIFENNRINRGHRLKWNRTDLWAAVTEAPMDSRMTFASMGNKAINVVLRRSLHAIMHWEGIFARHSSPLQPHLIEEQLAAQVACASNGGAGCLCIGCEHHGGNNKAPW